VEELKMQAGKLDRFITLERRTETVTASGAVTETWAPVATLRAELVRQSADEFLAGPGEIENGHTAMKTFINKADALRWSRETERKADQDELAPNRSLLRSTTLADVLTRYLDEVVPRKKAGKNEACMIKGIMRRDTKLVSTTLDRLNAYQFADWRDKRLQNMKASSVCRYLGLIQHALETAMRDWQLPLRTNPVQDVRRPVIRNKRERRLRDDERAGLMDAARNYSNPLLAPLVALALETGMRRGELLAIRWQDVDARLSVVRLRTSKNGHARTVPLSGVALRTLAELRETRTASAHDAHVFPMKGNAVQLAWGRIVVRAGISDL
jgi:integrase